MRIWSCQPPNVADAPEFSMVHSTDNSEPTKAELATFADIGVIWNEPEQFAMSRTRFGYGAGVRILFPVVDMIRFDVGVSEFGDVVFNFGIRSIFDARSLRTF